MGKIRRQRKKLHFSQDADNKSVVSFAQTKRVVPEANDLPGYTSLPENFDNIFAGIDISLGDVKKLQGDDSQSVVTSSKSIIKNLCRKKEERRKLRHHTFIEGIQAINAMKNLSKKNKKKISGSDDISLPSCSAISNPISNIEEVEKKPLAKRRGILKAISRHSRMVKDVSTLQKIWANPAFKADPTGLAAELVQNKIVNEAV